MHHTAAWLESVDAAAAYNDLTALADQVLTIAGDRIQIPTLNQVVAFAAGVGSGGNGLLRFETPSRQGWSRYMVSPVNGRNDGNVEPDSPHKVVDLRANPLVLVPNERALASVHSDTTAAAIQWLLMFLAAGPITPVGGTINTIRGTGTATLTASAWTAFAITFDETLASGRYQVLGARFQSAGCVAGRLVPVGGGWRPGAVGTDAQEDLEHPMFRSGGLGVWMEFENENPPQAEFLSVSADTAEVVYLDVVKVA